MFVILLSYFGIMARQGNKHNLAVGGSRVLGGPLGRVGTIELQLKGGGAKVEKYVLSVEVKMGPT